MTYHFQVFARYKTKLNNTNSVVKNCRLGQRFRGKYNTINVPSGLNIALHARLALKEITNLLRQPQKIMAEEVRNNFHFFPLNPGAMEKASRITTKQTII